MAAQGSVCFKDTFCDMPLSFLPSLVHYWNTMRTKAEVHKGKTISEAKFNDWFYTTEATYFNDVGDAVRLLTNMTIPQTTRYLHILTAFTS